MAARIQAAEQDGGFFRVEVCPNSARGVCKCSDPATQHRFFEYAGAPPAGAARQAWQDDHVVEAGRLIKAEAPVRESVTRLVGRAL
ncbi:MAG: hypothetical protein Q7T33_02605 [Dehalococcoidia bacterium]|nr:hypothetical protein [Dehalococcoidia bacterium]